MLIKLLPTRPTNKVHHLKDELLRNIIDKFDLPELLEDNKKIKSNISMSLYRSALLTGLSLPFEREISYLQSLVTNPDNSEILENVFNKIPAQFQFSWSALIKLRYNDYNIDLEDDQTIKKIINYEIEIGLKYLLQDNNLDSWLRTEVNNYPTTSFRDIPKLNLKIGKFEDDSDAFLNINSSDIANTQIIIAGASGNGKSNLLLVLMDELIHQSMESIYPVNFLLFDYKGEFSDLENQTWLKRLELGNESILNPSIDTLPINPFKEFSRGEDKVVRLYSTEIAGALAAIESTKISATMNSRLQESIYNSYLESDFRQITFEKNRDNYIKQLPDKDKNNVDTIISTLNQLINNKIFADKDSINLLDKSYIINLGKFPKDGSMAKAIIYFLISKLNNIYEMLPKQASQKNLLEMRHFTVIDEAHYMLEFENSPLKNLVLVGRNKGMSIILASQSMDDFKKGSFNFYENAQYPLIMKQNSIDDKTLKDLFGISGQDLASLKSDISDLKKGELIIKDTTLFDLDLSDKKYKKISIRKFEP